MRIPLLLLVLGLVLAEIAVFVLVGEAIGVLADPGARACSAWWPALMLLRRQGMATLLRDPGRAGGAAGLPARPLLEGARSAPSRRCS